MDDLLYFQDEAGNEIGLMMIDNFEFEGKNYALLATPHDAEDGGVYVMRMEEDENGELGFHMPDDEEMEKLTPFLMEKLELQGGCSGDCCSCHGCHGEDEDDDEDEELCEHHHCDCGCEH